MATTSTPVTRRDIISISEMTGVERAWREMKFNARKRALSGVRLSMEEAEAIVTELLNAPSIQQPVPSGAIRFFAREMLAEFDRIRPPKDPQT